VAAQTTAAQWAGAYSSHLQLVYETADIQECPCGRHDNLLLSLSAGLQGRGGSGQAYSQGADEAPADVKQTARVKKVTCVPK
jgi:hypothetical protein